MDGRTGWERTLEMLGNEEFMDGGGFYNCKTENTNEDEENERREFHLLEILD